MTTEELIAELSLKCFLEIRNTFNGLYMSRETLSYIVEAEVRLERIKKFRSKGPHLQTCLMSVRKDVLEYYQNYFPEYL